MQQGLQANLPQTYPYIQRSQYLADALQKLGSESQTIRSPGALAANLGSELLLQLGRKRADKQLLAATLAAQTQQNNMLEGSLGSDPSSDAPTAPAGPMGASGPAPVNPSSVTPASFTPPTPSAPAPPMTQATPGPASTDPKLQAMAALISGGMKPPNAAGLVGNFQQESGPNLGADNPSEGAIGAANWRGPRAQALRAYAAQHGGDPRSIQTQMAFALQEGGGPESGAFSQINAATTPEDAAKAAFGYERPQGWSRNGDPMAVNAAQQRIANAQNIFSAYQAQNPGAPTPQAQPPAASQGPAPSAPMGAPPVGPSPMGGASPPMPQPTQPPGPQQFMTHGPSATPQERALVHSLLTNPATRGQGIALAQKLAEQYAARPIVGQGGGFYGNDNQYHSTNQVHTIQQGPAGLQQQEDLTGKISSVGNVNVGAVAPNSVASFAPGGGAQVTPMQGATSRRLTPEEVASGRFGQFAPGSVVEYDPLKGTTNVVQQPQFDPGKVQTAISEFYSSSDYQLAAKTTAALNSLHRGLAAAGGNNGIVGMAAVDNLVQAQTGLSARQGNVKLLLDNIGVPEQIKGAILNVTGNGSVTPTVLRQIDHQLTAYASTHNDIAQRHLDALNNLAKPYGYNLGVSLPPMEPLPRLQWMDGPQQPQAQPAQQPQPMVQPPPQPQAQRRPGVRVYNPMTGKLE